MGMVGKKSVKGAEMRLFWNIYDWKLFHIIIIWYICTKKQKRYGKGYSCTFIVSRTL